MPKGFGIIKRPPEVQGRMETKNTGPGDCIPGFCSKLLCDITQDPLLLQALPSISTLGASSQVVPKALAHFDSLCRLYLPFSLGWGSSLGCARDREGQLVRFLEGPAGTGIHAHHGFLSTCAMSGLAQGPSSSRLLPPLHDGPLAHFAGCKVDPGAENTDSQTVRNRPAHPTPSLDLGRN